MNQRPWAPEIRYYRRL